MCYASSTKEEWRRHIGQVNRGTQASSTDLTASDAQDGRSTAGEPGGDVRERQEDRNLGDLLQELRILQQGSLVLTAFLIILPFNIGFSRLAASEHGIYVATFLCALASLILLSAPAAHHRLSRPLVDRPAFKNMATRFAIAGLGFFSIALILATYLIVSVVLDDPIALILAGVVGIFITLVWWVFPLALRWQETHPRS